MREYAVRLVLVGRMCAPGGRARGASLLVLYFGVLSTERERQGRRSGTTCCRVTPLSSVSLRSAPLLAELVAPPSSAPGAARRPRRAPPGLRAGRARLCLLACIVALLAINYYVLWGGASSIRRIGLGGGRRHQDGSSHMNP